MKRVVMIVTFDAAEEGLAQSATSTIKMSVKEAIDRYELKAPPSRKIIDIITSEV